MADIPPLRDPLSLTLPGGVTLAHQRLVELAQPALSPLVPVFDLVDTVVGVFRCLEAVPGALGPPPDPTALAAALAELGPKVTKLLGLVPQLSVPVMLLGLIDLLLDELGIARATLEQLKARWAESEAVVARAVELDDQALAEVVEAARANITQEAENAAKRLASLERFVELVNLFGGMVGAPAAPSLAGLGGQSIDQMLEGIGGLESALAGVRAAVPMP